MRVLLDESVPRQLAAHLSPHEVTTVQRQGWSGLRNGELLERAAAAFEVFVTGDQGLRFQQNLSQLSLGIVVIAAKDNRVETILELAPRVLAAVERVRPGAVETVAS